MKIGSMLTKEQDVSFLISIVADSLYVCEDGGYRDDHRLINDAYNTDKVWFLAWFIDVFVTDPDHKKRITGAMNAIDGFVVDAARAYKEKTGQSIRIPVALIEELKRRILIGYFPTVREIVQQAKYGPAVIAKQHIERLMKHEAWLMRS